MIFVSILEKLYDIFLVTHEIHVPSMLAKGIETINHHGLEK